jgi:hypothetical protein
MGVGLIPEVTVTIGLRTTAAACIAAGILSMPVASEAQTRRAVPRVVHSRPVARVGIYYGPSVYYRPWYAAGYYGYYGSPWFYGGWGYPYSAYGYAPWGYPYAYGGYYYDSSLRVQVSPREAEVFVDGYYAGTVDDFDGVFQRLHLEPGDHDLELFLPGHRSFQQKVYLQPGKTFNVRHGMEPLGPGDAQPVRPVAPPRATPSRSSRRQPSITPRDRDAGAPQGPEPTQGARSEFGSLVLRVQPGDANITIDGEAWENSGGNERLIVQLGSGVHNVQIRKDGYRTYMTDITVRAGETITLNVAMTAN